MTPQYKPYRYAARDHGWWRQESLAKQYQEEDENMDIQTYAHLLLSAHVALRRRQVLWVIK